MPPVRAGFLERPWRRVIAAITGGIALIILGGLLFVEYSYYVCNGPCTISTNFFEDFWSSIYFVALFPPFVPALLASALLTRGSKEGAIAGFIMYLVPAVFLGIPSFLPSVNCSYCALGALYSVGTPFLGALVGAGGGALGGWRSRRRAMSAKEVEAKSPPG